MIGTLYVIGTPIGNLGDITYRAIDVLNKVDLIICEDTRHTLKLLNHFSIKKPLSSYHQHSSEKKEDEIIKKLEEGRNIALVTDAGTPGISDPGGRFVDKVRDLGMKVEVIPGPSALTAALSVSGFETKEFVFYGFIPVKKGRQTLLKELVREDKTVVIYESPYRIKKLLKELLENGFDRKIYIGRELTKKFEEHYRGKIEEILPKISEKGEFVVILERK